MLLYDSVRDEEREMDGSQVGSEREVGPVRLLVVSETKPKLRRHKS